MSLSVKRGLPPEQSWGDEWPTLSPGGRGLGCGGNDQGGGKFFGELDAPQLAAG